MQRSAIAFTGYVSLVFALVGGCGPAPLDVPDSEEPPSTGGTGATGGSGGTGGTGGVTGGTFGGGTGGSFTGGTGGSVTGGTGGSVTGGTGGSVTGGTGGSVTGGVGGATGGAGGSVAGTGSATGGTAGAAVGGSAGTGTGGGAGTGAAGAAAVACDAAFAVGADGFVRAPAAGGGCWHGYASAGGDTTSMAMPTSFGSCGMGCMLRFSGMVGPSIAPDYAGVVYMGFNLNQAAGASAKGTVTPTGSGLAVQYTNAGASPIVRVQISAGSAATTRWCAPLTSTSTTIPYAMFNTECWEGGAGTAYAMQPIDTVQLIIPGGEAAAAFDITLVSVQDM